MAYCHIYSHIEPHQRRTFTRTCMRKIATLHNRVQRQTFTVICYHRTTMRTTRKNEEEKIILDDNNKLIITPIPSVCFGYSVWQMFEWRMSNELVQSGKYDQNVVIFEWMINFVDRRAAVVVITYLFSLINDNIWIRSSNSFTLSHPQPPSFSPSSYTHRHTLPINRPQTRCLLPTCSNQFLRCYSSINNAIMDSVMMDGNVIIIIFSKPDASRLECVRCYWEID